MSERRIKRFERVIVVRAPSFNDSVSSTRVDWHTGARLKRTPITNVTVTHIASTRRSKSACSGLAFQDVDSKYGMLSRAQ